MNRTLINKNMKNKILVVLLTISINGFSTVWTINNSGFTFSPATITISLGDTVNFVIGSTHNAREVSQATYNANGSTALAGGFQTASGGGMVLPAQLGVGVHYYVCPPHVSMGMKAIITVQQSTSVVENESQATIFISPNPSSGQFKFNMEDFKLSRNCKIEIYNLEGSLIYNSIIINTKFNLDLSNQATGIYFVKIYDEKLVITKKIIIQ